MPPFDETVVTLATVPLAAGATAGLFVRPTEFSVLGCTVGATAYKNEQKKFSHKNNSKRDAYHKESMGGLTYL